MQSIDKTALPAAAKAALRNRLTGLQKRVLDDQKAAAAANKAQATSAAVDAADSAAAADHKFVVLQLKVRDGRELSSNAHKATLCESCWPDRISVKLLICRPVCRLD